MKPDSAVITPLVDIVMVTYGRADLVRNSLKTLLGSSSNGDLRLTVVDNNSPDDTPDVVATEFPEVRLIRRADNAGFAVSNNQALELTTAPYVLLLNPDTEVSWPTIQHLVDKLEADPGVGMIGCRLLLDDGSFDHAAKRSIPTPLQALKYFTYRVFGLTVGDYVADTVTETGVGDVEALNGAFMLVRRAALDSVGGLDESYWMYAEDLDWCVRFREAGWRIVYDGTVTALHVKGACAGRRRSLKLNYHFHRSMAIFYRHHLADSKPRLVNGFVLASIWIRFALVQGITLLVDCANKLGVRRQSN